MLRQAAGGVIGAATEPLRKTPELGAFPQPFGCRTDSVR